ncbi:MULTISPECIES: hypothetical protein [unclassified Mycobacteroides]|uniref:hypothetical protein n=1 Tax=unclassified Mycobacteroides TaxID=2618759 RepID=UPI0012DBFB45|nr:MULTISPECIES: hypothetical protein [unclassified Mycobacteroides]MUM19829.1 hypothetical protein [Mycobacteroides sp. CBMA 326]
MYPDPHHSGGLAGQPPSDPAKPRPIDIDTGCWLWLAALPLMIVSYMAANVGQWEVDPEVRKAAPLWSVYAFNGFIVVVVGSLVATAIFLMRAGYRLARTFLTGGAVGSVVFTATRMFGLEGVPAIVQALSGITAAVLICGGLFLLHREDSTAYLTRQR